MKLTRPAWFSGADRQSWTKLYNRDGEKGVRYIDSDDNIKRTKHKIYTIF